MTRTDLIEHLRRLEACSVAREWATATLGTPEELWHACKRGDWLLWFAARAGVDRRAVVLTACDCAETATPHLTDSTRGPALAALETARRLARGEAPQQEVRIASAALAARCVSALAVDHAAYAAAYAVHAVFVSVRSVAADDASMAATCAASAIAYAAYTTTPSSTIATYAAVCAAIAATLQRSADIVRARIPWTDVEAALLGGAS